MYMHFDLTGMWVWWVGPNSTVKMAERLEDRERKSGSDFKYQCFQDLV